MTATGRKLKWELDGGTPITEGGVPRWRGKCELHRADENVPFAAGAELY
jgi:hypothetical protein